MKLDKFLNFIFRKGLLLIVCVLLIAMITVAFTGCFWMDTLACTCAICGCDVCADACVGISEACDAEIRSLFPDDCMIADCFFGDGCDWQCGDCKMGCLGFNYNVFEAFFFNGKAYDCGCTALGDYCSCGCGFWGCEIGEW